MGWPVTPPCFIFRPTATNGHRHGRRLVPGPPGPQRGLVRQEDDHVSGGRVPPHQQHHGPRRAPARQHVCRVGLARTLAALPRRLGHDRHLVRHVLRSHAQHPRQRALPGPDRVRWLLSSGRWGGRVAPPYAHYGTLPVSGTPRLSSTTLATKRMWPRKSASTARCRASTLCRSSRFGAAPLGGRWVAGPADRGRARRAFS